MDDSPSIMLVRQHASHGSGRFTRDQLKSCGDHVVFEEGVLIFHPENVRIGNNVYIGHGAIIKGYHVNELVIEDNAWIGQRCFLHGAGGLVIENGVGVGPGVSIITSQHNPPPGAVAVLFSPVDFAPVRLRRGCDLGVQSVILPGVTVGKGAVVGAGAVVAHDIPEFEIWAGVPARFIRRRK